jgi:hypothetical protein
MARAPSAIGQPDDVRLRHYTTDGRESLDNPTIVGDISNRAGMQSTVARSWLVLETTRAVAKQGFGAKSLIDQEATAREPGVPGAERLDGRRDRARALAPTTLGFGGFLRTLRLQSVAPGPWPGP